MVKSTSKVFFASKVTCLLVIGCLSTLSVISCLSTHSLGMSTAPIACTPGEGLEIKEIFCDSSLREIIKTYTESHSRYDTFVVTRPILMNWNYDKYPYIYKGLLVGPGYRPLYDRRTKHDTLRIGKKVVLAFDSLRECELCYREGFQNYKRKYAKTQDTYIYKGDIQDKELSNYLYRAIYIDRKNGKYVISQKMDTIMAFPLRLSKIRFPDFGTDSPKRSSIDPF